MSAHVHQLTFWQRLMVLFGAATFKLWAHTLRFELSDSLKALILEKPQSLILLWHNRLALALMLFYRYGKRVPLTGLVSASRDGAMLAQIMHAFGIQAARGSSSRRAMSATKELIEALKANRSIVITPDGPRGPLYQAKPGIESIASLAPVRVLHAHASRYWALKSWDKFILPKPFSTVRFDMGDALEKAEFSVLSAALEKSK